MELTIGEKTFVDHCGDMIDDWRRFPENIPILGAQKVKRGKKKMGFH